MFDKENFKQWFFETAMYCGCYQPHEGIEFLRNALNHMPMYEDENQAWYAAQFPHNGARQWFLSWIDSLELTEHGCSINGSWLLPKGEQLRDFLNALTDEEIEEILD